MNVKDRRWYALELRSGVSAFDPGFPEIEDAEAEEGDCATDGH